MDFCFSHVRVLRGISLEFIVCLFVNSKPIVWLSSIARSPVAQTLLGLAAFLVFVCVVSSKCGRRGKAKKRAGKRSKRRGGPELLELADLKPDFAKLRIVKETELRKRAVLGPGTFGTVYKVSTEWSSPSEILAGSYLSS